MAAPRRSASVQPAVARHVSDDERRARLAVRHGLAPGHRHGGVAQAVDAMTVLHATEPASVPLALWARVGTVTPEEVDRALHVDRAVVRQLAMRRTLFVFPRDLLPAAWGSAAARTAASEYKGLMKAVVASGLTASPDAWWDEVSQVALERIREVGPVRAADVAALDPRLGGRIVVGSGRWTTEVPLGPRVVLLLGAQGRLVRVGNAGHWRSNRPVWDVTERALPDVAPHLSPEDGYVELVRRWLWTFGPGTEADIVWWLGSTKTAARAALERIGARAVSLDSGSTGWLLPDDLDEVSAVQPWAALLPVLDPTVMGWRERDFHLDPEDVPYLFDTNGNAGTTAWWNGRIVGCWVQDPAGVVQVVLRPDQQHRVGAAGLAALDAEAARLTQWLDGTVIGTVYSSRQMKGEPLP